MAEERVDERMDAQAASDASGGAGDSAAAEQEPAEQQPAEQQPAVEQQPAAEQQKKGLMDRLTGLISGCILPVLPGLIGCGLVSCLVTILTVTGLLSEDSDTYTVLYGMSQLFLYFFPIIIAGSAAQYFGINVYVGNVIGAALVYPTFVAAEGTTVQFLGFIPVTFDDYSSTIFPAIVAVWLASVVYKFMERHTPKSLQGTLVPWVTVLVTVPIELALVGPAVNLLSNLLTQAVMLIYNFNPIICGAVLGGLWYLIIIPLGLHFGFMAVCLNNFALLGYEPIMGLTCNLLGICGTMIAVGLKSGSKETRDLAFSCALTNFLGVSEPGLFGVILPRKKAVAATFIGNAIAGAIAAACGTYLWSFGGASGIFSAIMYINPSGDMWSFVGWILSNVVGFAVCFALTYLLVEPDAPASAEGVAAA